MIYKLFPKYFICTGIKFLVVLTVKLNRQAYGGIVHILSSSVTIRINMAGSGMTMVTCCKTIKCNDALVSYYKHDYFKTDVLTSISADKIFLNMLSGDVTKE